jgi:hypothetical protein
MDQQGRPIMMAREWHHNFDASEYRLGSEPLEQRFSPLFTLSCCYAKCQVEHSSSNSALKF